MIHKQQIIVGHRAIFEVELSFLELKFYIVIKRKIHNKVIDTEGLSDKERKEINKQLRNSSKKPERHAGGPN